MFEFSRIVRDSKPSEAMVFNCSDNDFRPAFESIIKQLGLRKYTPYIRPGPAKSIVEDPRTVEEIEMLRQKHGFRRLILLPHINCAAIGIPNEAEEIKEQFRLIKAAGMVIEQAVPGLQVESHLVGWSGEIFEEPASG